MICASTDVPHDKIASICFKSLAFILVFFLFMWFLGIANDQLSERSHNNDIEEDVFDIHTFGFIHYFGFSLRVLSATILFLYINRKNNLNTYVYFVIVAINLLIFSLTYTRLHILLLLLFLSLYLLYYKFDYFDFSKEKYKYIGLLSYSVCQTIFLILIVAPFAGLDYFRDLWDYAFSGRMVSSLYYFAEYGINLMGNEVTMSGIGQAADSGEYDFYLDAGYAYWLIVFGIIYTLFILTSYSYLFFRAYILQNWALYTWLIVFCVGNFINDFYSNADINPVILFLFADMNVETIQSDEN